MNANYKNKIRDNQIIKETLEKQLKQAFSNGMACGCKVACKVILDKITNNKGSSDNLVTEIAKFCKSPLKNEEENKLSEETGKTDI